MIQPVFSSTYDSNCYLVWGGKAALIDAGADASAALSALEGLGRGLDFLVNTHLHFDHVGGDAAVKKQTGAKICVHEKDAGVLERGGGEVLADWFGRRPEKIAVDVRLIDGQVLDLGGLSLEVIHTPGHTPGGICLYEEKSKALFSGDTIFADGVGRTDISGGSDRELEKSVRRLAELHERRGVSTFYPGHGPPGAGEDIERILEECFA